MPRRGGKHFTVLEGAQSAMEAFRMEIAEDLGLLPILRDKGFKGLTTQQAGSIGGEMVKRIMVAGEMAVVDRHKNGQKLSPNIPSDTIINSMDPTTGKPHQMNESQIMAQTVVQ